MESVCAGWLAMRRLGQSEDGAECGARSHYRPDLDDDGARAMLLRRSHRDSSRFGGGNTADAWRFRSRGSDRTLRLLLLRGAALRTWLSRGRIGGVLRRGRCLRLGPCRTRAIGKLSRCRGGYPRWIRSDAADLEGFGCATRPRAG